MTFEPSRLTTATDVLSTANLALPLDQTSLTTSLTEQRQSSQSLLFIDQSVAGYQSLIAGATAGTEVHILNSTQDAVTQITNTLLGRDGISSLHILSHGEAGGLDFGSNRVTLSDLPGYAAQLQSWSKALSDDADILLYGCNVAQGELGQAFTSILSQLTGADIAASDDLTGGALLGGNWTLETANGFVESSLAFTSATIGTYAAVLNHSRLLINDVSIVEGDSGTSNAVFTVTQTGPGPWTVSVNYTTVDGTAVAGSDYVITSGTLNFANSETTKTITVPIIGDRVAEFGETFSVVLSNAVFGQGGAIGDGTGIGTIGTVITNQTLTEDIASGAIPFSIDDGDIPNLLLAATSNNQGLIADNNLALGGSNDNRTITITPTANQFGNAAITLQASDGINTTTQAFNVTVTPVNDAPLLTLPTAGSVSYIEDGNAVILDASATVSDIDSTNFDTGMLTVNISTNGTADDRLAINNQGTSTEQIGVSGSNVTYGGTIIGTVTGGVGTAPLVVTFNSSSSSAAGQALLRNLTYSNVSDAPSSAVRTLSVVLTDGDGGISTTADTTIDIVANNDPPTVFAPAAIAVTEDITTTLTGITFVDADASSGIVIATLTVGTGILAATSGGGVTVGGTATNRTISGTITDINSFIAASNLTYTPAPDSIATQTLGISINDNGNTGTGGAQTSGVTNISLNVTAVNDVPSFAKGADLTITAGSGVQTVSNWATGFNPGPADESNQTAQAYIVTVDTNPAIFAVAPTIDSFGNLTYTPATNLATATTATLSVHVRDSGGTANGGVDTSAVQTFAITVQPQPTLSIGNVSQTEGNSGTTAYTFTVSLSNASAQTVAVNYTTADGTATVADGDYSAATSSLTFAPGETSKTITINVKGDPNRELDETFFVNLLNPTNATLTANATSGTGTLLNDDRVNLVWRSNNPAISSSGSGQNAIWQMNSFTLESGYYLPTVAGSNWQIVGTADFNQDGTDDLLWRNQATGENAIWQLNSIGFQSSRFITSADLNWQIASTADFNNDGTADIVWRHQATGQNAIWQMNSTGLQNGYFITSVADLNWQIASTADFNNDGTADILWRNKTSGQNAIWQMNGFTLQSSRFILPVTDSNWQMVGTADFNNDGIADIVWRHQATGQNAIWQMNSTDVQTGYYLTPVADLNWQIAGVANFNGDGSADLLWRNPQTGKVGIWQMNEFTDSQTYLLPDVSLDWVVRPLRAPQASVPA
ncbi:MAG: DUF4347 domain-containing protein [Myxacorys californica WJT36-NPBG1]|nr:DUF4347 domain-containing protein [Myxacorys californica WJT36-NPBG1]